MFASCGDPPTFDCLPMAVAGVVKILFMFLGAAGLIYLLWGSLRFVMSGGDPKAIASARGTMTYAVIGLIVILLSFAILNFLGEFLGLPKGQLLQFGFGN